MNELVKFQTLDGIINIESKTLALIKSKTDLDNIIYTAHWQNWRVGRASAVLRLSRSLLVIFIYIWIRKAIDIRAKAMNATRTHVSGLASTSVIGRSL